MLTGPFRPRTWMGACDTFEEADWVMVGLPYDGTCSYRPGSRFAPEQIRLASYGLETYSPYRRKDLENVAFFDAGELELPFGNREKCLSLIGQAAAETYAAHKRWLGVGGEHLVTLPVVQACIKRFPDLVLIQMDAHGDLREEYLGESLSHATVVRRIAESIPPERLIQIGIRSGPGSELNWMERHGTWVRELDDWPRVRDRVSNRPVFLTVDVDVLDPAFMPGTGTPEPGGITFKELLAWFDLFEDLNLVGADVVELAPPLDPSGNSTVAAAKILREILLF